MRPVISKAQPEMFNQHYDDVQGVILRPTQATTPAAVKIKIVSNEDPLEAKNIIEKKKRIKQTTMK